jgi:cleavage and polyadenylation specificity factor subunit 3
MAGQRVKVNCSVEYISFSAHTDYKQTSQFIRSLKPAHIILVHGEKTEMEKLKKALISQYEDSDYNIQVYDPRNTQPVELTFRGEKSAKVIGKLASNTMPRADTEISGVLVKRNFKYHLLSAEDLPNYTDLAISTILQRQSIPIKSEPGMILHALDKVFGSLRKFTVGGGDNPANTRFRLFDAIDMIFEKTFLVLEVCDLELFFNFLENKQGFYYIQW